MQICAISGDKKFLKIGEDFNSARWYGIPDALVTTTAALAKGDIVVLTHKQGADGKLVLETIKKTGAVAPKTDAPQKTYGKSPEEQDSIKRQAIGHMTSRTLIALQGQVDVGTIESLMEKIYKKYQSLVG